MFHGASVLSELKINQVRPVAYSFGKALSSEVQPVLCLSDIKGLILPSASLG